jgi:hypothetical protein
VLLDVVTVSVEEPEPPPTAAGLKLAVELEGRPLTLKLTVPVYPFSEDMLTP